MRIDEFGYELPPERIAQRPAKRRDESRLMVLQGSRGPDHRRFSDLPELLREGDLLVVNDARVLPARVVATRSGGGRVELLFLSPVAGSARRWRALAKPARRVRAGETLRLSDTTPLRVVAAGDRGERTVEFPVGAHPEALLEAVGQMPLPPYIRPEESPGREDLDRRRYQTVYAASDGAVAAPTAGLHFTHELLQALRRGGVEIASLTLHVGPGTFRPITVEQIEEHSMDGERFELAPAAAEAIGCARRQGRRVIAVGTTVVRTLEHAARAGEVVAGAGEAGIFIRPGYQFRVVNGMITNFHLPRSTPILLVAALLGRERLLAAYQEAIDRGYRFYSYGDAMLILP